jgi:hypothetical protein
MIMITGIGFIIAATAGLLGFSIAIGAFFAGLIYSRDPQAIKMQTSFTPLYDFFTPFFFIGIGLDIDPNTLPNAFGPASVLLLVAIVGKLIGTWLPAVPAVGWRKVLCWSALAWFREQRLLWSSFGEARCWANGQSPLTFFRQWLPCHLQPVSFRLLFFILLCGNGTGERHTPSWDSA